MLLLGTVAPGQSGTGALGANQATVTDEQRAAVTVTSYALEVHLLPAQSGLSAIARLTLRNDGPSALTRIALELSSTLRWDSISGRLGSGAPAKLHFDQHQLETDADHTGAANEAVIELPTPLAAGQSVDLTTLYSGKVARSGARRMRAGATVEEASSADWDEITTQGTLLRGFGDVLWYPVASPQVFLEQGAQVAEAVAEQRFRQRATTVQLRIEVESGGSGDGAQPPIAQVAGAAGAGSSSSSTGPDGVGEDDSSGSASSMAARLAELRQATALPVTGFFCGQPAKFSVVNEGGVRGGEGDGAELPAIAVAEWPAMTLGFGSPSLFIGAAAPAGEPVGVAGATLEEAAAVEAAARAAQPLVAEWLGERREREPVLLAHGGVPFAQRALLVEGASEAASRFAMTHLLSHAWFRSPEVWLDEGLAQFLPLVAIERGDGRAAALAQLRDLQPALSLADATGAVAGGGTAVPGAGEAPQRVVPSESLVNASREVFFRNKAVSVLWMLRSLAGDRAMEAALAALKQRPEAERGAKSFEAELERASGKDLAWFFRDWVLADHGLPDLTIVSASPRSTVGTTRAPTGNLVAVEVRNDGHAEAEVPVTVRSGTLTATERLRVPAMGTASVRILFQGTPLEVQVNDGTVPEVGPSEHVLALGGAAAR